MLAHWSVRQKLNQVSSAQFSYVALYAPLVVAFLSFAAFVHFVFAFTFVLCITDLHTFLLTLS